MCNWGVITCQCTCSSVVVLPLGHRRSPSSAKFAMETFMKFDWHYSVKQWLTLNGTKLQLSDSVGLDLDPLPSYRGHPQKQTNKGSGPIRVIKHWTVIYAHIYVLKHGKINDKSKMNLLICKTQQEDLIMQKRNQKRTTTTTIQIYVSSFGDENNMERVRSKRL